MCMQAQGVPREVLLAGLRPLSLLKVLLPTCLSQHALVRGMTGLELRVSGCRACAWTQEQWPLTAQTLRWRLISCRLMQLPQ